jgi:F-type H+-transporting ATPase subunit a
MLGKNLPLSYFLNDPQICNSSFLGIPALGSVGSIHVDTILLSVACMAIILSAAAMITPRLTAEHAGGDGQSFLEMLYGFVEDITKGQIGSTYKYFLPLIAGIFIFVLIANFIGVGPWKAFEGLSVWPKMPDGEPFEIASPTTDFNVTFALATISILTYLGSGFWAHGIKYIKAYLNPIEWLDLIIRPSTLALRLMMVITADELMRAAAIGMAPAFLPTGVMGFELFIGVIQAFVFALLTSIYIGLTVSHH